MRPSQTSTLSAQTNLLDGGTKVSPPNCEFVTYVRLVSPPACGVVAMEADSIIALASCRRSGDVRFTVTFQRGRPYKVWGIHPWTVFSCGGSTQDLVHNKKRLIFFSAAFGGRKSDFPYINFPPKKVIFPITTFPKCPDIGFEGVHVRTFHHF